MSVEPASSAVEQWLLHRLEFELEEQLYLVAAYTPEERRLLHFRQDGAGLVIGIDPQSATNLRSFIDDIRPVVSSLLTDPAET